MSRSSLFIVVGEFTVDSNDRQQLIDSLMENRRQTLATEDGCRLYEACIEESDDPTSVVMVEIYDNREAFENHKMTPHFAAWSKTGEPLVKTVKAKFLHRMLM